MATLSDLSVNIKSLLSKMHNQIPVFLKDKKPLTNLEMSQFRNENNPKKKNEIAAKSIESQFNDRLHVHECHVFEIEFPIPSCRSACHS